MDKLSKILDEATKNIRDDRKVASILLDDVVQYISQQQDRHAEVGMVASKYLETLHRSNEQLVKIATLLKSKLQSEYGDLEGDEKDDIYDELEEKKVVKKV